MVRLIHPSAKMGLQFTHRTDREKKEVEEFIHTLMNSEGALPEMEVRPDSIDNSPSAFSAAHEHGEHDLLLSLLHVGAELTPFMPSCESNGAPLIPGRDTGETLWATPTVLARVLGRIHRTCELRDPTDSRTLHLRLWPPPSETLGIRNPSANSKLAHVQLGLSLTNSSGKYAQAIRFCVISSVRHNTVHCRLRKPMNPVQQSGYSHLVCCRGD